MLPGVTRSAFFLCMKGAGSVFSIFSIALRAITLRSLPRPSLTSWGTMSSRKTGMPALAMCAAMPLPITPAPITAALRISMKRLLGVGFSGVRGSDRFKDRGDPLTAADALGRERELPALALQQLG